MIVMVLSAPEVSLHDRRGLADHDRSRLGVF